MSKNQRTSSASSGKPQKNMPLSSTPIVDGRAGLVTLTDGLSADVADDGLLPHYQAIMQAAGYVIFTADDTGRFVSVSEGAEALTGYTPDELTRFSFIDLVHPGWREYVTEFYTRQFQEGTRQTNFEFPIVTRTHEERWLEITVIAGDDVPFQAVARDITDRRRVDDALQASERRNSALIQALPDIMFTVRRDGTYTDFNWYHDLTGVVRGEQMIGQNIRDFNFGAEMAQKAPACIEAAITTGHRQHFQFEAESNGQTVSYEARIVRLNDDEALFIVRDLSDQMKAERQLAENLHQLATLNQFEGELAEKLDLDYVLMMGLDAAMRLGHADAGYILLREEDGSFHVAKQIGDHNREITEGSVRNGRGVISRVIRERQPELVSDVSKDLDYVFNRSRTYAQMAVPLIIQENLIGVLNLEANREDRFTEERFDFVKLLASRIAVAVDNARLYRQVATQLAQLRDLYKQVSTLEQLKTDMIRIASHDLRNPLFVILGHLEMMRLDIKRQDMIHIEENTVQMEKSARQMQKLIADILSLERIEQSVSEDTSMIFDLTRLVAQVCADYYDQAALQRRTLKAQLPAEEYLIRGDMPQMREAISNFISNAIKYTRENGSITVRLWGEGAKIHFEVEDNGIGIPDDQQERLFQPFYRAQTAETARIEGTGLGLHLVKNIVERHGGAIRFKSIYGEGSTFGFTLRAAPEV